MNKLRVTTIVEFYVKQDIDAHYKVFEDWSAAVKFYNEQIDVADAKNLPEPVLWDRRAQAVFDRA
jgi:hypothetical protein